MSILWLKQDSGKPQLVVWGQVNGKPVMILAFLLSLSLSLFFALSPSLSLALSPSL